MKLTTNLLMLIGLICPMMTIAQTPTSFSVSEESLPFAKGQVDGYVVEIPEAQLDHLEEAFVKYLRKEAKIKIDKNGEEYQAEEVNIERLGADTVNVYAKLLESQNGVKLYAAFEEGDVFLSGNTDSEKAVVIKNMLVEVAEQCYINAVEDEIKEEEKTLKELEKDLSKLENEHEKYHKTIADNNSEVINVQMELNEVLGKLGKPKVGENLESLGNLTSNANLDEKERKSLEKDEKKLRDKIYKMEAEIRDCERDIPKNEKEQEEKNLEIEEHKIHIESVESKLEPFK